MAEGARRFDPPRPVRVRHDDGRWYRGEQDGWVWWPDEQRWRASVTYTVGVGEKYVRSVPDSRVAPADD